MQVVSRREAIQSGLSYYFTGKPCKNGHIAKRLANGKCTQCKFPSALKWREYNKRWKEKYPGREQEVKYRHRYGLELSQLPPKPEHCDICGNKHKKIVLDHCHQTGAFRGWLCDPCNQVLGATKENVGTLTRMLLYLKKPTSSIS